MDPSITSNNYNKVANWWNANQRESNYGMEQLKRAIKYCERKYNALDVGCGVGGRVINELEKNGFEVLGIDMSPRMIELAKLNHPNNEFINQEITKWSTSQKFDFIIAWDSIFHLETKLQAPTIKKLCSLLNPDGIIVYTFGDSIGDIEDMSFQDKNGGQLGELENDLFGYGSIGINGNLRTLIKCGCKIMHMQLDQYPLNHVYVIGKKERMED
ncbi:MAG: class I SAM-dependent methyltransferase [Cyanobacteria bacterium P01_G01_bin.54]